MSEQQKLSVTYGSFSCDIIGFSDPLPVLQDVIGEFRQIAWRFPGFGAQKEDAQRDRLSRLVASKLDAALSEKGVSVGLDEEDGGLLVRPVDGEGGKEGWGDLYAKPKAPGAAKPAAAATAGAGGGATGFFARSAEPEPAPDPQAKPLTDATPAEVEDPPVGAFLAEDPANAASATVEGDEATDEAPPAAWKHANAAPEDEAPAEAASDDDAPESEEADDEAPAIEEPAGEKPLFGAAVADESDAEQSSVEDPVFGKPVAEETAADDSAEDKTAEEPRADVGGEAPNVVPFEEPAAARSQADEATRPDDGADGEDESDKEEAADDEGAIAVAARREMEDIVGAEVRDALDELRGGAAPEAEDQAESAEDEAREADEEKDAAEEAPKSGLFSRLLGAKKKPSGEDDAPLHLTDRQAVRPPGKPEHDPFAEIARQSGVADRMAQEKGADEPEADKDFVFAPKPGADKEDPALILSSEDAVKVDEDGGADRIARAKEMVMQRARERQAAQNAAAERRLRIIRREQVEEKADDMAGAVDDAARGKPAMSAEEFAKLAGAASLQELMEASAAYATLVGGKHKFTRSDLMEVMSDLDKAHAYSHEARIKSFGKLLRTGVLLRVDDGLFAMSQIHRHPYETKLHA